MINSAIIEFSFTIYSETLGIYLVVGKSKFSNRRKPVSLHSIGIDIEINKISNVVARSDV